LPVGNECDGEKESINGCMLRKEYGLVKRVNEDKTKQENGWSKI
jgi:hypothetical protein